jgi:hypothetical protein
MSFVFGSPLPFHAGSLVSLAFHKITWPFMNHMAQVLNILTKVQVEEQFCILALAYSDNGCCYSGPQLFWRRGTS